MTDAEDRKWAIEVEGITEPVGFTALYGLFRQTAPELGALIGDNPGARGVGREAERLTVAKAFEEFGAHRVYGRIPSFNGPGQEGRHLAGLAARGHHARAHPPPRRNPHRL